MYPIAVRVGQALAKAAPSVVAKVSTRIGTQPTIRAIMDAIRNNKLLAGYAAFELFGPTDVDLVALLQDKDVGKTLEQLISSIDYTSDATTTDLDTMDDEFMLIEEAASNLGGFDNLIKLRNALALSNEIYVEHAKLRRMGYRR